jgi:hypothetical protein
VDKLWISPGSLPGARCAADRIEAPRNSLKTPENSQKSSLTQRPGSPAAQDVAAGPASKLRNSRKKVKVSAIFVPERQVTHRARPGTSRATFGIKSLVFCEKNFAFHLDMLPGEGIYTRPGYKRVS